MSRVEKQGHVLEDFARKVRDVKCHCLVSGAKVGLVCPVWSMEWPQEILDLIWEHVRVYVRPRMMKPLHVELKRKAAYTLVRIHGVGLYQHYYEHPYGQTIPFRTCIAFLMNKYSLDWMVDCDENFTWQPQGWILKKGRATVSSHRLDTLWNNLIDVVPSDDESPVFHWKGSPPWFWHPADFKDECIEE